MAIDRGKCQLMTDNLIGRFDELESRFVEIREGLKQLWGSPKFQELWAELETIRALMERPRYQVGFLGRSQVGKSSTLNSVLRASPGEEPCTGGQGAAATSTVTRIHRRREGEGRPEVKHTCWLRYMTPTQFAERRAALCKLLGFDPAESDDSLRSRLESLLGREADAPDDTHADKIADYRYFLKLLRTHRAEPSLVVDPAREEEGDFALRSDYTNHPKGEEPWKYLLLREVEIGYHTHEISEKIELIDLPGLGARMASDDELTKAFLPNLDGALIFQDSGQVAAKEAYDLLAALRKLYPRLTGRVWMVITKFDPVPRLSLGYGLATSILDNIDRTMADNKVPLSQVIFVGNEFHRQLLMPDGTLRTPTADHYRLKLNLDVDESGRPVLPPVFARHGELVKAYLPIMEDGGIERVRQIIGMTLAEQVEREVRSDVDARLERLRGDLRRQVQAAKDVASMDGRSFEQVVQWKVQLQRIQQRLSRDRALVEAPYIELISRLQEQFAKVCPADFAIGSGLLQAHKDYVRVLNEATLKRSRAEALPKLYESVGKLVGEAEAQVGAVRVLAQASPLLAWRSAHDRDLADPSWYREEAETFDRPPLFAPGEPPHLRDEQYRAIMGRKIEAVGQRLAFVAARRVREHLGALIDGLALIQETQGHADDDDDRVYDGMLARLA